MIIIHDINDEHSDLAGGKATSLLRLRRVYRSVPDLFVLCPDSERDIDANVAMIMAAFDHLGSDRVAVRSSASVEDRQRTSFAGLFETRLNVNREGLIRAIHYVYGSRTSTRVRSYCERQGVEFDAISMGIIVQKQIPSDVSGVCFSRYSRNDSMGLVEACWGMGESIVSGKETPDHYVFDRGSTNQIVEVRIGNQLYMVNPHCEVDLQAIDASWNGGSIARELVPPHKRLRKKLLDSEISSVAQLSLQIEEHAQYVCADIEFCFHKGDLYLLQARPGPE